MVSTEQKSCLVQRQVSPTPTGLSSLPAVLIRAWELMQSKENDVLTQVQELFCLRGLVTSSNTRSDPETSKKPFFSEIHLKRWLLSLWRVSQLVTGWYKLDTSWYWLALSWHCTGAQRGSIDTDTLCKIVKIASGNLPLISLSLLKSALECIKQDSDKVSTLS